MGATGGPNIERDGLVFGYDSSYPLSTNAISSRFYAGEPTTNISSTHHVSGHNSGNYGNVVTVADAPEKGIGWKKVTISNRGSNFRIAQWAYTTHTSNVVYSHSAVFDWGNMRDRGYYMPFDGNGGGTRNYFKNGDYSTNGGNVINAAMKDGHFGSNIVKSGTHVHAWFIYNNSVNVSGLNDYFYYKEYQVEINTTPTPYTSGTRSSTQSLIDLKRTTDIDVDDVSFNSTGQLTFDGTDDVIEISDPNVSSSTGFSIEMIIKPNNASSSPMVITPNSAGIDHFVRFNSNGRLYMRMVVAADSTVQDFTTTTSLSSTDYHHITFTFKQSEGGKAYYNSSLETSASANFTAQNWSNVWKIGQRGNNTFFFNGELPILKIHNKVLSSAEVKQNFNAYKNRFGL